MKINVTYIESTYKVKLWFFKTNLPGVYGIAEWEKI